MHRTTGLLGALFWGLSLIVVPACGDDDDKEQLLDSGVTDTIASVDTASADTQLSEDAEAADASPVEDAVGCDPTALLEEALNDGTQVINGVQLEQSTPIGDIMTNPDQYNGQIVRVEGFIVEICQSQGCYVTLQDPDGNNVNLKVTDGKVNFQLLAEVGRYAVGEGVFQASGSHGAQVFIDDHGAMIGKTICLP